MVAAPLVAFLRRLGLRRRGTTLRLAIRRTPLQGFCRLRCELDVPRSRLHEVAAAVSGVVAEGASRIGRTVGSVGIVAGEEPVLVALAPLRDVVAARVLAALLSDEAHRRPELWLTLPPGGYLGKVVDPYVPFEADARAILDLLKQHGVGHALLAEVSLGPASCGIALTLYASRREARKLLRLARTALADLPGWAAIM